MYQNLAMAREWRVVFPEPGLYQFVVLVDKDHKASQSIEVSEAESPGDG